MPFWRRPGPGDETPADGAASAGVEVGAGQESRAADDLGVTDEELEAEELEAEALAAAESTAFDVGMAPTPWAFEAPVTFPPPEARPASPIASQADVSPPVPAPAAAASTPASPVPAAQAPVASAAAETDAAADEWLWGADFGTIDAGVEKSRSGFMGRLRSILGDAGASGPSWDDVEETLIAGDVGGVLAMEIVERARRRHDPEGPEAAVRAELAAILAPGDADWMPAPVAPGAPAVILVVGVNGTGKTTTIGKLAARYHAQGHRIVLAAGDTFRAAAIDQLRIWADRSDAEIVAHAPGADPGAVVYDALDAAAARRADIVIADTAGRLHTKSNLMDELAKIRRIVDKRFPGAIPEVLFVLDATTGQNGLAQAKAFHETVGLTGLVLTKLDSTSKGGIVFAIEDALAVPVRYVGVGERVGDLIPFDPDAFVSALFG